MITVVGSANIDLIARVSRLPEPGETVLSTHLLRAPGGKGANQAVAAARAGAVVSFVGRVGNDLFGTELRERLGAAEVLTEHVRVDESLPTGMALIAVDEAGENTIVVVPGANSAVSPADVDAAQGAIAASRVVVLQLEIPVAAVSRATALARAGGAMTIVNASPAQALEPPLLRAIDVLVVNRDEVAMTSGLGPPIEVEDAAATIRSAGVGTVIVTLGAEGAVAVTEKDTFTCPALAVDVVDSVGAGDAFVGALACELERGRTIADAMRFASAAAAWSVGHAGAQPSMPSRAQAEQLLREGGLR